MPENNQEGYRSIGWIINKSEQGLFLVSADEKDQMEIADIYSRGDVEIYDYRRHLGEYSFHEIQEWVDGLPQSRNFMFVNFHLGLQEEDSIKRLNFSRDMLEGLNKNLIFLVTPYMDDKLALGAYDFYSFLKLRINFQNSEMYLDGQEEWISLEDEPVEASQWVPEDLKEKMAETEEMFTKALDEINRGHFDESDILLRKVQKIREKILGPEHLETVRVNIELAGVYECQGKYEEAEELQKKSLQIVKRVLGKENLDTAISYNNLAGVYEDQGKYREAEELYIKSLTIIEKVLGKEHPDTATGYNNIAYVYERKGNYQKAEELYEKCLQIREKILGEEHPDTAISYNNLANLYMSEGRYRDAEKLYGKSLEVIKKVLGEEHPTTATIYNNLAKVCARQGNYEMAKNCFVKSYNIDKNSLGKNHPDTQEALVHLRHLFYAGYPQGDFEQWLKENEKENTY